MNLMDLISGSLNASTLDKMGSSVGAAPSQVANFAQIGLPTLLQALGRNASSPDGAASLLKALEKHQDRDVDDLDGFLDNVDTNDGAKIIKHVFSGNEGVVRQTLASQTGLNTNQVAGLLTRFAPMILGILGNQKKKSNLDADGISGLLSGVLSQGTGNNLFGMATRMLDSNNDGNVMDDLGKMLGGFFSKK